MMLYVKQLKCQGYWSSSESGQTHSNLEEPNQGQAIVLIHLPLSRPLQLLPLLAMSCHKDTDESGRIPASRGSKGAGSQCPEP